MIIGVAGDICAGKETVVGWLRDRNGFQVVHLQLDNCTPKEDQNERKPLVMTADAFMGFVMQSHRWKENWVVSPVLTVHQLHALRKRPFFLLLGVEAPFMIRYKRYLVKYHHNTSPTNQPSLERFVELNDGRRFSMWQTPPSTRPESPSILDDNAPLERQHPADLLNGIKCLSMTTNDVEFLSLSRHQPDMVVFNGYDDCKDLETMLDHISPPIPSNTRLRPGWDDYFMLLADLAARRSNCMKRQVGCILVKKFHVISTGYNGTPRGVKNCNDGGCPRCNRGEARCGQGLQECLCLHAEENALIEAGRERIDDSTALYCNTWYRAII
jgi:dCMP deaminase